MPRLAELRQRFARPLRILVLVGILGVILAALGTAGFIEYSAQPSFCDNCHIMEPYYQSWATSSHNQVPCIKCHYAPGVKAEAMGKIQAANQVVKYITGTYGTKPWAEIEDAACMRSGCHSERKLEGVVVYKGVRFDHAKHLGELRRGKQLRCTSCHSQIVQGQHVTVTESTCFLCHFKGRPVGEPVAGCTGCHPMPPRVTSPTGFIVDHPQYVRDLVSCVSCHSQVIEGTGEAQQSRCFNCHNEPARLNQFNNTTLVHRVHISEHNVECTQCHTPIEHRIVALTSTFELDCASCHQNVHDAQRRLYAGLGGHGTKERPSAMFLASVTCEACHGQAKTVKAHERVQTAGEASCLSCHGIRYANILPAWQQAMERKVSQVATVLDRVRAAARQVPLRQRAAADSLLALAGDNVELVRVGRGAHNIAFADDLLHAALDFMRRAVRAGSLPYQLPAVDLGPPVEENACLTCHLGVERRPETFRGRAFNHQPHVLRAGLACTACHTPLASHGGTTLTAESCDNCHHSQVRSMNCATCHAGAGGAPDTAIATPTGNFPHRVHLEQGFTCDVCHAAPQMSARELNCDNCHDLHHQPDANCLSCHRGGAKDKHDRTSGHTACQECHGDQAAAIVQWSRQVCTVCHVDRVAHNAPKDCVTCHRVPALRPAGGASDAGSADLYRHATAMP